MKARHNNYGILITVFSLLMIVQYSEGSYNAWDVLIPALGAVFGWVVFTSPDGPDKFEQVLVSLILGISIVGVTSAILHLFLQRLFLYDLQIILHPEQPIIGLTPAFLISVSVSAALYFIRPIHVCGKRPSNGSWGVLGLAMALMLGFLVLFYLVTKREIEDGREVGFECMEAGREKNECLKLCTHRPGKAACEQSISEFNPLSG